MSYSDRCWSLSPLRLFSHSLVSRLDSVLISVVLFFSCFLRSVSMLAGQQLCGDNFAINLIFQKTSSWMYPLVFPEVLFSSSNPYRLNKKTWRERNKNTSSSIAMYVWLLELSLSFSHFYFCFLFLETLERMRSENSVTSGLSLVWKETVVYSNGFPC